MISESKLAALRFRRSSAWYGLASVATVAALAIAVSLFTWWNDLYKPIVHPIEALDRSLSRGGLEQVDEQVATLLGVGEETVRNVRDGLISASLGASRLGGLHEIAAGQPTGADSKVPAPATLPTRDARISTPVVPSLSTGEPSPPAMETSPVANEPSPTDMPSSATEKPAPPTDTPPPTTGEPPAGELPPLTGEPPPATGESPLPTETPPPTNSQPSPPPADTPPPDVTSG